MLTNITTNEQNQQQQKLGAETDGDSEVRTESSSPPRNLDKRREFSRDGQFMASLAAARAILISRAVDLSFKLNLAAQPPLAHHLLRRPLLPAASRKRSGISCLVSGVDGGGVSDEFVSTRKSGFGREFSVLANMLKRIEPLDNSVISKGVSDSAKDSMKQTISTMLGLLPSDQFDVVVKVSKQPMNRLIVSSIVTGYTLWNAEYRISLMRNFDISPHSSKSSDSAEIDVVRWEVSSGVLPPELEKMNLQIFGDLPPEALQYIQQLELELSTAKQELRSRKQEILETEHIRKCNNNLLEYLRSLESDMVTELSRPSSPEVEEIIHQLAQTALQKFYKDDFTDYEGDSASTTIRNHEDIDELCYNVTASRDYLAKLLFWCMLLGHHVRGLENRLHLSCAVGLL